jgi:excisionase family DNA binding protein
LDTSEARDSWLTPAEAAELFGVTTRTLINWARAGKIGAQRTAGGHRASGHRRYRESDALALLAELIEAAA